MLVPNQKFVVRRHRSNKEHYNSLGYYHEPWTGTFEVPAEHLSHWSRQRVLFICDTNPEHPPYLMSIDKKAAGCKCPTCSGKGIRKGVYFGDRFPDLIGLWSDKNVISPFECKSGSPKKVWFKCESGKDHPDHEMSPFHKGTKKQRCPYCVGLRLCEENSLEKSYPDIASEWHPLRIIKLHWNILNILRKGFGGGVPVVSTIGLLQLLIEHKAGKVVVQCVLNMDFNSEKVLRYIWCVGTLRI